MTSELPDWMIPPRPSGWEADDLDHLPQAPRHTELIDGALIFIMWPRRSWHTRLVSNLTFALCQSSPEGFEAEGEMTVRLDKKSRPEPDILVTTAASTPTAPGTHPPTSPWSSRSSRRSRRTGTGP